MTTITTTNQIAGQFDDDDKLTAKWLFREENKRRVAFNSTVPPPVTPLPLLNVDMVGAERKAACEAILNSSEAQTWASWTNEAKKEEAETVTVKNIREAAIKATPAQRTAALTALTT